MTGEWVSVFNKIRLGLLNVPKLPRTGITLAPSLSMTLAFSYSTLRWWASGFPVKAWWGMSLPHLERSLNSGFTAPIDDLQAITPSMSKAPCAQHHGHLAAELH